MKTAKLFLYSLIIFSCNCKAANLNEKQAVIFLANKFEDSKISEAQCLSIRTSDSNKRHFDFSVHEKHNDLCGGDPETNPLIGIFRVYRVNHNVMWLNTEGDKPLPFDEFVQYRKK